MNKNRAFYKQPWFAALAIVLVFVLILSFSANALWQNTFGQIKRISPEANIQDKDIAVMEKEILNHPIPYDKEITNILLLGIDSRDPNKINTRSDAMMILTVNQKQKKLKLTSLQRDMLVPMPGREEMDKLTHANVYGGPEYVMETVNGILRLNIDRYVVINMRSLETVIDMLGGVELDVPQDALSFLGNIIDEQNKVFSDTPASPHLTKAGLQKVNGRQGVAFARNRSTAGSDYDRMEYQKQLLQAIFSKFLDIGLREQLNIVKEGLSYITTNLSETEMLGMMQSVLPIVDEKIEMLTIPIEGYHTHYSGEVWLNLCDFNGMIPILQDFIFGKEFPFDPVPEIPGAPNSSSMIEDHPVDEWITEPQYYYDDSLSYDSSQYVEPSTSYVESQMPTAVVTTTPVDTDTEPTIPPTSSNLTTTVPQTAAPPADPTPEPPAENP